MAKKIKARRILKRGKKMRKPSSRSVMYRILDVITNFSLVTTNGSDIASLNYGASSTTNYYNFSNAIGNTTEFSNISPYWERFAICGVSIRPEVGILSTSTFGACNLSYLPPFSVYIGPYSNTLTAGAVSVWTTPMARRYQTTKTNDFKSAYFPFNDNIIQAQGYPIAGKKLWIPTQGYIGNTIAIADSLVAYIGYNGPVLLTVDSNQNTAWTIGNFYFKVYLKYKGMII